MLVLMGVLAPGSAHAKPSAQPPINPSEKKFLRSVDSSFETILSTFRFFPERKSITMGQGVPPISFYPKSYFCIDLKPHAKFRNPTITPSRRKVMAAERKKRR